MIDLVYIYELGLSDWREQELKYSLRSVEKFMKNYRDIYIIGEIPPFINVDKIKFIPFETPEVYKEHRIMLKFLRACEIPEISKQFLMMNDDYFLVRPIDAANVPYYYDRPLNEKILERKSEDKYYVSMFNTFNVLRDIVRNPKYFDIHYPMKYDKEMFPAIMNSFDWNIKAGYVVKSLYANLAGIQGKKKIDRKIMKDMPFEKLLTYISTTDLFSTFGMNRALVRLIHKLYPLPSIYEV